MVKTISSRRFEKAVRIELLRARAAVQRESLVVHTDQLSQQINPVNWLGQFLPGRRKGWLRATADVLVNYPMLSSLLSTLLMGRSSRVARAAGMALAALQAVAAQQNQDSSSGY